MISHTSVPRLNLPIWNFFGRKIRCKRTHLSRNCDARRLMYPQTFSLIMTTSSMSGNGVLSTTTMFRTSANVQGVTSMVPSSSTHHFQPKDASATRWGVEKTRIPMTSPSNTWRTMNKKLSLPIWMIPMPVLACSGSWTSSDQLSARRIFGRRCIACSLNLRLMRCRKTLRSWSSALSTLHSGRRIKMTRWRKLRLQKRMKARHSASKALMKSSWLQDALITV